MSERRLHEYATELIWDAGLDGTAIPKEIPLRAPALRVGPDAGWLPPHILSLAASSCYMSTLLRLAEGAHARVLGYVSHCSVFIPVNPIERPSLTLLPCIVVPSAADAAVMGELCVRALRESHVCRTIRHVRVEPDVQIGDADRRADRVDRAEP